YVVGEWRTALSEAEAFIAEIEAGMPHYLANVAYLTRGRIQLERGEAAEAAAIGEEALRLAARAADPQQVLPTQAHVAHIYYEFDDRERAASLANDSLSALKTYGFRGFAGASMHVLSWTLTAFGRGPDFASAL